MGLEEAKITRRVLGDRSDLLGVRESEPIAIEGLSYQYAGAADYSLSGISLSVRRGECLGLIGPNGAGKSTLLKLLAGLLPGQSGSVRIAGFDVFTRPVSAKRHLGYVPEVPALYDLLTAREYLELICALHDLSSTYARERQQQFLDYSGLVAVLDNQVAGLSKGMRQKLVIGAALLHDPTVLVLDEPFDGLDGPSAELFAGHLEGLLTRGAAALLCSHDLALVQRLCERVAVIRQGRLIGVGTRSDICALADRPSFVEACTTLFGISTDVHKPHGSYETAAAARPS